MVQQAQASVATAALDKAETDLKADNNNQTKILTHVVKEAEAVDSKGTQL